MQFSQGGSMANHKKSLLLGVAPTRRDAGGDFFCNHNEAQRNRKLIETKLTELGIDFVNLDFLNEEGLIWSRLDAEKVARNFNAGGVDALFIPHVNFGTEDAVAKLARIIGKPTLLWGMRDAGPDERGNRLTDTQCGLFATGKALNHLNVPFTYLTNSSLDDASFTCGLQRFISTAQAVKSFKRMRIGQIGTRPDPFWSVKCNEMQLLERYGIEIVPDTLLHLSAKMKDAAENRRSDLDEITERIRQDYKVSVDIDGLRKTAAMKYAIKSWADEYELDAVAANCWSDMQVASGGISPCFTFGMLTGEGLPVICETDIHGAISSVLLQAASRWEKPSFLADMTIRHPENDNAELLWHCGVFPPSLADGGEKNAELSCLFTDKSMSAGAFELKRGDITVCRFDATHDDYLLFMAEGKRVDGPGTNGTYGWFEFKNWPAIEHKLVYGPYIHHCTGIYDNVMSVLYEACKYIPGLIPDPTEEDLNVIRSSLL
jgi:L-fucose isomerase-like protein